MDLEDSRWGSLEGGYRVPFDPRPSIRRLAEGGQAVWDELWQELYHQGDVGSASFAAVPLLVEESANLTGDWNFYALVATIEEARSNPNNPLVPDWISQDYADAWLELERLALQAFPTATSAELISSLIAVLAHAKGQITMARMALLTEDERADFLNEAGWG